MTVDYPSASLGITGERGLIGHLVNPDSLAVLIADGLKAELLPSESLRPVYEFAMDYFARSGCNEAPTIAVLRSEFALALDDAQIDLEVEPEATIQYVVDVLKAQWVRKVATAFTKDFAVALAEAGTFDHSRVLGDAAATLVSLSLTIEPRASRIDVREAAAEAVRDYEVVAASKETFRGLRLGLEAVDMHTRGIRPGELCVVAAPPKTGKSWFQAWAALQDFNQGRRPCLITLENSVRETMDRIACMAVGVNYSLWQHGELTDEALESVRAWSASVAEMDEPFWILQPDLGQRSFEYLVREAQVREADSLFIDQLTFVEMDQSIRNQPERYGNALHRLKGQISTGNHLLPCVLTHQINREGVKAADKAGHLEMYHMAEASEVERTADAVAGLYQGRDDRAIGIAKFQWLAARRFDLKSWEVTWKPFMGQVNTNREIVLS